jgi:putative peptidoglycan lipid II flippase
MAAVAANLIFNSLTYRQLGAPGLALGTTVAALVNLGILRLWFGRVLGRPRKEGWLLDMAFMILANAVLAGVVLGVWHGITLALEAAPLAWPRGLLRVVHAVSLLATIAIGFVTYVGVLRLFRLRGAEDLWELPRKVIRRLRPRSGQ